MENKYTGTMDKGCLALCDALNRLPGIQTIESCAGHGERPFHIWFFAENLEALPQVAYYFARCHSGCSDWNVIATTDCGMSPISFMIEGPVGAYADAEKIAKLINEHADEEAKTQQEKIPF